MKNKSDIEKIRMACELRRREYCIDLDNNPKSEFFREAEYAIAEFLRKLQDIKYIEDYIEMKAKYMSDSEKGEWLS